VSFREADASLTTGHGALCSQLQVASNSNRMISFRLLQSPLILEVPRWVENKVSRPVPKNEDIELKFEGCRGIDEERDE